LFSKNQDGQFILRVEDTDLERSRPEFTDNILEGLDWLGLTWDAGPVFQSKRLDLYRQMVQTLLDRGLAYRCYCTPEELDEMRSQQKAKGQAPRYDNRHRDLTPEQIETFEAEGRTAVIRFKIDDDREIVWNDLVRGRMVWKGSDLGGDMVVARASSSQEIGQPLYNLAVVVDDIDLRITHVIRGEDHIANTAKQILLYEAFEADIPEFAHTPLILNQSGQKLSKRDGVTSISDFKEMGFTAEALVNYMTLLGWSPPDNQEMFTLAEAATKFSFDRVNKAGAKFDWDKLDWLNSQYIHRMPVDQLTDALIPFWQKAGYTFDATAQRPWLEALTALIGPSLTRLTDAIEMSRTFFVSDVEMTEAGREQLEREGTTAVLEAILDGISNQQTLTEQEAQDLIKEVTKAQKVKKGLVMRSLRAALTGDVHGPDLIQSWVLLHQRGLDRTRLEKVLKVHVEEASALTGNPSTEQPKDTQTDASASPPGGATSASVTPDATTSQLDGIKNQIVTILSDLPEYVTAFVKDYQKPLVTVGLILAILVSLRVLVAVLDVLNGIPLVQPTFEIVGLSYSIWFVYRYLLSASTRSELSSQLEQLKQQVAGDKAPKN
jgi:glutamyl-tRNA synthetase